MTKFMILYRGRKGMGDTPEEQQQLAASWMSWYQRLGASVLDGGHAFGASSTITAAGTHTDGTPSELTGYVIIEATDVNAACELAGQCPALSERDGRVEIHEALVF